MSRFVISVDASRDLNDIVEYYKTYSLDAGDRFVAAFNQKCLHLTQFPNIGKRYPALHPTMRGIVFDRYILFYEPIADGIVIARIVSGNRNLTNLFATSD
jgi:toxin ParE1/3/4